MVSVIKLNEELLTYRSLLSGISIVTDSRGRFALGGDFFSGDEEEFDARSMVVAPEEGIVLKLITFCRSRNYRTKHKQQRALLMYYFVLYIQASGKDSDYSQEVVSVYRLVACRCRDIHTRHVHIRQFWNTKNRIAFLAASIVALH